MIKGHNAIVLKLLWGAHGDLRLVPIGDAPFQRREYGNLADANDVVLARITQTGWAITGAGANWILENLQDSFTSHERTLLAKMVR
jgi:hypothetical protein